MEHPESISKTIENDLMEMMKKGKLPSSGKFPSLNKLAQQYGVSRSTIHRVFQKLETLGFVTIVTGRGIYAVDHSTLKKKLIRDNCISLILPNMAGYYLAEIARGVESVLSKKNYYLAIFDSTDDFETERENLHRALAINSKGILLYPVVLARPFFPTYETYVETQKTGVPFVFIKHRPPVLDADYVGVNNFKAIYDITSYLIQQGHRTIAYLGQPTHIRSYRKRAEAFWKAMEDAGIEVDMSLTFPNPMTAVSEKDVTVLDFLNHAGTRYLEKLLTQPDRPSAVIFDKLIQSIIQSIRGFAIPDDLSVASIVLDYQEALQVNGNICIQSRDCVNLTGCIQPTFELGRKAGEVLIDKIEGGKKQRKRKVSIELDMPLYIGNSVKRIERTQRLVQQKSATKT